MRQRRAETSRISSRGKGSVYSTGGGGRTLSRHRTNNTTIIAQARCNRSLRGTVESPLSSLGARYKDFIIESTSFGQAACMIIEDYPPLPTRSRQNLHQDTTERFLNHLVLPKHGTSKFSSNRHRKLQPFRET
ncbi:uncharacterized protein [Venturia canescens]|uniref:uncharacterized protein isoform X2 n=1 Tax=Venturia canescens TaxID=32260 RepID=UPI001C9C8AF9|nr:uncharacterized protein LOC122415545 isoform X2 [Venturia canescens]